MTKKELREKYKTLRSQLSNADLEIKSKNICKNLLTQFNLSNKKVSVFIPISKFNEINTWLIIDSITMRPSGACRFKIFYQNGFLVYRAFI